MNLVVHREIPEREDIRRQWNELVKQMESPEVFYTYEWALAVSCAYGDMLKPLLLIGYEGDTIVGVASLATHVSQKTVTFLAATTADYCDFVCSRERIQEFTVLVLAELRAIASNFIMASVPTSSATAHALQESSRGNKSCHFSRPACQCAQVKFGGPEQRDLVRGLLRNKKLERHHKKIWQLGPVTFRHITNWNEIAAELPRFRNAHIERFCAQGRSSNLADPRRWHFVQRLAELLSAQGWMTLSLLSVGDQPIAWNYGFVFEGSWFWYQPTFDERFRAAAPGLCLLAKIIEDACGMPEIDRVDLGLGEESYKARFATEYRDTVDIAISSSMLHHMREKLRYSAASAIKSSPNLEQCVRWLLRKPTSSGAGA